MRGLIYIYNQKYLGIGRGKISNTSSLIKIYNRYIDDNNGIFVSTSNLLVIPQNDDLNISTMIVTDAVIDNSVLLHFSNLPLDLKRIRIFYLT